MQIGDFTLKLNNQQDLSFREKLEIAGLLEKMEVDAIEVGFQEGNTSSKMLIKAICSTVKEAIVSVTVQTSVNEAWDAVKGAKKPRLQIELPLSTVQMEYNEHKKPDKVLAKLASQVKEARCLCPDVEFVGLDATRADRCFLFQALNCAIENGATVITVADSAGLLLGPDAGAFAREVKQNIKQTSLGFMTTDTIGMAGSCAIEAHKAGCEWIKTVAQGKEALNLGVFAQILLARGLDLGLKTKLQTSLVHDSIQAISSLMKNKRKANSPYDNSVGERKTALMTLGPDSTISDVSSACSALGYDLSQEDKVRVFDAFKAIVAKKNISNKELDAIVASAAMQVPPTYKLKSYVINSGNIISSTSHIELEKNGELHSGLGLGDGPVDASFMALEKILGHHYELDDFQIQAVTEGREAMGQALVRLRSEGILYSGTGISLDIIGASIRAYINALNKIVYEEGRH